MNQKISFLPLLFIALLISFISPYFFAHGMFFDGTLYSNIAMKYSQGIGEFWAVQVCEFSTAFLGHPPFVFFIQSIFYDIFDTNYIVDKFICLFFNLLSVFGVVLIWRRFMDRTEKNNPKIAFFPLILWISIPIVSWGLNTNVLEITLNALIVFSTLCIILSIQNQSYKRIIYLFLAGLLIFSGILAKGAVALFPLAFIFIYWLIIRPYKFKRMVFDSLLLIVFSLGVFVFLLLVNTEALEFFTNYYKVQLVHSFTEAQTVTSRFYILHRCLSELLPAIGIGVLVYLLGRKATRIESVNKSYALVFFLYGLCAVIPIMLTLKQSGFYLLPSFPYLVLAITFFVKTNLEFILQKFRNKSAYTIVNIILIVWILAASVFAISNYNTIARDEKKLVDLLLIDKELPKGIECKIHENMREDWSLIMYWHRYKEVTLSADAAKDIKYYLIENNLINTDEPSKDYSKIYSGKYYSLYVKESERE